MSHHSLYVFIWISLYNRNASTRNVYNPNKLIRDAVIESIAVVRKFRKLSASILPSRVLLCTNTYYHLETIRRQTTCISILYRFVSAIHPVRLCLLINGRYMISLMVFQIVFLPFDMLLLLFHEWLQSRYSVNYTNHP